jgi:hypothetical protein
MLGTFRENQAELWSPWAPGLLRKKPAGWAEDRVQGTA